MLKSSFDNLHNLVCADEMDLLNVAGIYIMIDEHRHKVYIGQAAIRQNGDAIITRISEDHNINWNYVIIIVDNNFSPRELDYLEYAFYELAKYTDYEVKNAQRPGYFGVNQAIRANLDMSVEFAVLGIKSLGYREFDRAMRRNMQ